MYTPVNILTTGLRDPTPVPCIIYIACATSLLTGLSGNKLYRGQIFALVLVGNRILAYK